MPYGESYGLVGPKGDPFVHKRIFGGLKGLATGGLAGAAAGFLAGGRKPPPQQFFPASPVQQFPLFVQERPPTQVPVPGARGAAERVVPGGRTGFMECPRGFHPDKATGTRCVRNRSMNPGNIKALRRGLRREESFIRLARRTGLVAVPKATRTRRAARKRR